MKGTWSYQCSMLFASLVGILGVATEARAQTCNVSSTACALAQDNASSGSGYWGTTEGLDSTSAGVKGEATTGNGNASGAAGVFGICINSGYCNGVSGVTDYAHGASGGAGVFGCEGAPSSGECTPTNLGSGSPSLAGVFGLSYRGSGVIGESESSNAGV